MKMGKINLVLTMCCLFQGSTPHIIKAQDLASHITHTENVINGQKRGTVLLMDKVVMVFNKQVNDYDAFKRAQTVSARLEGLLKKYGSNAWWDNLTVIKDPFTGLPVVRMPNEKEPLVMGDDVTMRFLKCADQKELPGRIGERFRFAFQRGDVDPKIRMQHDKSILKMPPSPSPVQRRAGSLLGFAQSGKIDSSRVDKSLFGATRGLVYKESAMRETAIDQVASGDNFSSKGRHEDALQYYVTSIILDPEYFFGYESIIREYKSMGDTTEASNYEKQLATVRNIKSDIIDPADKVYERVMKTILSSAGATLNPTANSDLSFVRSQYEKAVSVAESAGMKVPAYHYAVLKLRFLQYGAEQVKKEGVPSALRRTIWAGAAEALISGAQ